MKKAKEKALEMVKGATIRNAEFSIGVDNGDIWLVVMEKVNGKWDFVMVEKVS